MGVNSLEKLHKTKFHYIVDTILSQRTLGVVLKEKEYHTQGEAHALISRPRSLIAGTVHLPDDLGQVP